ncbi:flavin oxidoreductase / NADH oxidase family [Acididesulfobacillus acetoxydans]|uniref:NADH oxidase n=1 Tax=Acididesulfobacillus acetoxydans TaxID=1561005 RepID=A0A8S0VW01_9FIRM|nr:FAD-dependent oxidoreductase [Acididesulfobacillus acetoxydans]CAA7600263.1 flavin oxidoreductase / NADH oxidase family [Acididesulfobacillus acetoxydans]CEJ09641.1 NADH oxidase [Acididesulfobacillus acetoxydans]
MEKLFQPINIGKVEIKNRIAMVPMANLGLVTPEGSWTKRAIDYYQERAKGGTGLIITGAVKAENEIERLKMPSFPCITTNPAQFLQTASELVEHVHAYGAKIFIQITLGLGRVAAPGFLADEPVAPSAIPNYWDPTLTCRELTTKEVEKMVKKVGEAAHISVGAGFDGMEIHAVHEGYLLDQFTLALFNRRTDKYGGDLRGRLTFPIEIVREIKREAGKNFPVSLRFSIKSYIKDWRQGGLAEENFPEKGRDLPEGLEAANILEAAGYDAFNADAGSYDAWYWAHPPLYQKHGCYLPLAAKLKQVVSVPVIVAGRLDDPELARQALAEGKLDIVGIGRGLLTDPDWPKKVRDGQVARIRPCIGCHNGCMGRMFEVKPECCTVNPAVGREKEYALLPARQKKKIMIIGGGIAGMEAARVCTIREHRVTLYEKSGRLGGHVNEASTPDFKEDDRKLLAWYKNELKVLKTPVKMETEVDLKLIEEEKPDVIIVATGSQPGKPDFPGADSPNVAYAAEVLEGIKKVGEHAVVVGGGLAGCETALFLAQKGNKVTLVETLPELMAGGRTVPHMNKTMLIDLLAYYRVEVILNAYLAEYRNKIAVVAQDMQKTRVQADTLVLAVGYKPDDLLYKKLNGKFAELYLIGDAREAANMMNAIWDAYDVAKEIEV